MDWKSDQLVVLIVTHQVSCLLFQKSGISSWQRFVSVYFKTIGSDVLKTEFFLADFHIFTMKAVVLMCLIIFPSCIGRNAYKKYLFPFHCTYTHNLEAVFHCVSYGQKNPSCLVHLCLPFFFYTSDFDPLSDFLTFIYGLPVGDRT